MKREGKGNELVIEDIGLKNPLMATPWKKMTPKNNAIEKNGGLAIMPYQPDNHTQERQFLRIPNMRQEVY